MCTWNQLNSRRGYQIIKSYLCKSRIEGTSIFTCIISNAMLAQSTKHAHGMNLLVNTACKNHFSNRFVYPLKISIDMCTYNTLEITIKIFVRQYVLAISTTIFNHIKVYTNICMYTEIYIIYYAFMQFPILIKYNLWMCSLNLTEHHFQRYTLESCYGKTILNI